jgi:hypothetical protein
MASGNLIKINGNHVQWEQIDLKLPATVMTALAFGDICIVLLDWTELKQSEGIEGRRRNVWAIDQTGNVKWRIAPYPGKGATNDTYTGIWEDSGKLVAYNGVGYDFYVDPATGAVTYVNPKARPW